MPAQTRLGAEKLDHPNAYSFPVRCTGVDWLTVTCNDNELMPQMESWAVVMLDHERQRGNDVEPWRFLQFEGFKSGGVGFGTSGDMHILRLSSETAHANWTTAYTYATNCSRIDLQVTISDVPNSIELISELEERALFHFSTWLRPPEITLRKSNRTGMTLYFNKRVSDRFGRVYDKALESKDDAYAGCVRCEVQFNGKAAKWMSSKLYNDESRQVNIPGYVSAFLDDRGVGRLWSGESSTFMKVPRRRSDAERRLTWIRNQVRPAVQGLIAEGRYLEVIRALGLEPPG